MKPCKDNSYCHYPFIQAAIGYWDKQGIQTIAPCCNAMSPANPDPLQTRGKYVGKTITDAYSGSELESIREQMRNGEYPDICAGCYEAEKSGTSPRLMLDDTHIDPYDPYNPSMQWLDFHVGERCNLRCRHCHPHLSNRLREDASKFIEIGYDYEKAEPNWWQLSEPYLDDKNLFQVPDLQSNEWRNIYDLLPTIKHIRISGGETLLSNEVMALLAYTMNNPAIAKNIVLEIFTNATKFTLFNNFKLRLFKSVELTISIDGTEKTYEYVRHPMKFEALHGNFRRLFKHNNNFGKFDLNFVANSYNVLDIANTIEWFKTYDKPFDFVVSQIYPQGRNIDPIWLPREILEKAAEQIKPYIGTYQVENFYNTLVENFDTYDAEKLKKFKEETLAFDKVKQQSYKDYCHPMIVEFIDSI